MPRTPRRSAEAEDGTQADYKWAGNDSVKVIQFMAEDPVITEQDALKKAKLDPAIWRVENIEVGAWQTPMKLKRGKAKDGSDRGDIPIRVQCWKIRVTVKRVTARLFEEATNLLMERVRKAAPQYPQLKAPKPIKNGHMIELDLFDSHFGKLAWAPETGQDYNLKLAERIYSNAVGDLLNLTDHMPVAQFVFPIGNDFFHVDNNKSETTGGTRVDSVGRPAEIFKAGCMAVVAALETVADRAPVRVFHVPGNHDEQKSYYLAMFLSAWFRNSNRVEVDTSPASRKYIRYGQNLIGYIHGDKIKPQRLPNIMATERPKDWGETTCHEWRQGHLHKQGVVETTSVQSHEGCMIRNLSSLSATDSWHYDHGFVGSTRAAEAYVMHHDHGFLAHFIARAR